VQARRQLLCGQLLGERRLLFEGVLRPSLSPITGNSGHGSEPVDEYDERPTFSNFGSVSVNLAAPGVKIETTRTFLSTLKSSLEPAQYGRYTGTSAAAAHVTGEAALLKSQDSTRVAKALKQCLVDSVYKSPWLKCWSGGRLNLGRALSKP
jgi:hypothetical protein